MGHRGRRQKLGCIELLVVAFILFVGLQVGVFALRLVGELVVIGTTLARWVAVGAAGAIGVALAGVLVFYTGKGLASGLGRLFGWKKSRREARQELSSYRSQAREWRVGIRKTIRRLRKRRWLSRGDALRYWKVADAAVLRLRALEGDLMTLRSLPATEKWTASVDKAARTIVDRLEQTHMALVKLLAESALQPDEGVASDLRESADELESLLAAIEDVKGSGPMSTSTLTADRLPTTVDNGQTSRASESVADELKT